MGQFLELISEKQKKLKFSKFLKKLEQRGYLKAAFSSSEVKALLKTTGDYLKQ